MSAARFLERTFQHLTGNKVGSGHRMDACRSWEGDRPISGSELGDAYNIDMALDAFYSRTYRCIGVVTGKLISSNPVIVIYNRENIILVSRISCGIIKATKLGVLRNSIGHIEYVQCGIGSGWDREEI